MRKLLKRNKSKIFSQLKRVQNFLEHLQYVPPAVVVQIQRRSIFSPLNFNPCRTMRWTIQPSGSTFNWNRILGLGWESKSCKTFVCKTNFITIHKIALFYLLKKYSKKWWWNFNKKSQKVWISLFLFQINSISWWHWSARKNTIRDWHRGNNLMFDTLKYLRI